MKTLVVTGGSRGIGLATAREFQAAGWRIVSIARTPCPLAEAASLSIDLAEALTPADVARVHAAIGDADRVALVHNAGVNPSGSIRAATVGDFRRSFAVNVLAPFALTQAVLPAMGPGSSVLFVGSTLSEKAVAGTVAYTTSKHAVVGLMRSVTQDLAGSGIHCACVCPGFTDTEMLREHLDAVRTLAEAITCFGRLIAPEEIARVLYFCAENPVVNGAVLHANLGQIER